MQSELEDAYFGEKIGTKKLYQISAQQFQLECLSTNLNAGDSTGLRTYSGSHVQVRLAASFPHLLDGKNVVELGCGVGVFGLVGTQFSSPALLVLTDGEPRGSSIVEKNIKYIAGERVDSNVPMFYRQLRWGDSEATNKVLTLCSKSSKISTAYDIVLGCELMYFNTDVALLVQTVLSLTHSQGLFIHGHLFRGHLQEQQLIDTLAQHQWSTLEVPHKEFISAEELGHHVEWYRVRPLISGPDAVIAQLALEHPTWRVFQEEIVYEDDDTEGADDTAINIFK